MGGTGSLPLATALSTFLAAVALAAALATVATAGSVSSAAAALLVAPRTAAAATVACPLVRNWLRRNARDTYHRGRHRSLHLLPKLAREHKRSRNNVFTLAIAATTASAAVSSVTSSASAATAAAGTVRCLVDANGTSVKPEMRQRVSSIVRCALKSSTKEAPTRRCSCSAWRCRPRNPGRSERNRNHGCGRYRGP